MAWRIIWSSFAERQLSDIHEYYLEEAGAKVAKKITSGIIKAPNSLIHNPELGQLELSLDKLPTQYHYILFKSYKLIYSIDIGEKQIRIADVFDVRQDPDTLKRKK